MAIEAKLYQDSTAPDFSQTFVDMVEEYGRGFEFGLATRHYLKHFPLRLPGMAPMGLGLLTKKRMNITPTRIKGIKQLKAILKRAKEIEWRTAMAKYLLYPGCSMESSAKAYRDSLLAVAGPIGLELEEIDDWNCCGATEYLGISLTPAYALISRNLALAAKQANGNRTVVAPCSACYLNLAKADYYMQEQPKLGSDGQRSAGGRRSFLQARLAGNPSSAGCDCLRHRPGYD